MSASPSASPSSTNATRRSGRLVAEYYQRVFGKDLPESVVGEGLTAPAVKRPDGRSERDNPLEAFRLALAGATRAIARGRRGRARLHRRRPDRVGQERQGADAGAHAVARRRWPRRGASPTRRRCGCAITMPALHRRRAPGRRGRARAVFDAAEQARVEALGARAMAGVRANLARLAEMRLTHRPADPGAQPRGGAAGLGGRADGARAADRRGAARGRRAPGSTLVRDWIEEKAGADLDALGLAHRRPGRLRRRSPPNCCATSSWSRATPTPISIPTRARRARATTRPRAATRRRGRGRRGRRPRRGRDPRRAGASAARSRARATGPRTSWARASDGLGEEGEEGMLPVRPNRPLSDLPPQFDYRVFTSQL